MDLKVLRAKNFELTKKALRDNITRDVVIIQTIHSIKEMEEVVNRLIANLRERFGYYAPRVCREADAEGVVKAAMESVREDMGISLTQEDIRSIKEMAIEVSEVMKVKENQEVYLGKIMQEICPLVKETAGVIIGAELIDLAGSFKHLAELPSSTIQVLGAEKALFRHIKTGARPPRFGVIFAHESISNAKEKEKGKAARKLASKIAIAAKKDYFGKRE